MPCQHLTISAAVNLDEYKDARHAPFIQAILGFTRHVPTSVFHLAHSVPQRTKPTGIVGNADLAVLRPENQKQTTVTPFVDYLADGLFRERLHVLGPKIHAERTSAAAHMAKLKYLLKIAAGPTPPVEFPPAQRLQDEYWNEVRVNHSLYYKVWFCSPCIYWWRNSQIDRQAVLFWSLLGLIMGGRDFPSQTLQP